jgi:hypothetical protein
MTIISVVGILLQAKSPIKVQENTLKNFNAFSKNKVSGVQYYVNE